MIGELVGGGRHRHRACVLDDVEPRFETFMGPGSPADYVLSKNLHRRNLTKEQRLHAVSLTIEWMKKAAAERQREAAHAGGIKSGKVRANLPEGSTETVVPFPLNEKPKDEARVRTEVAKLAGVSSRTAQERRNGRRLGRPRELQSPIRSWDAFRQVCRKPTGGAPRARGRETLRFR